MSTDSNPNLATKILTALTDFERDGFARIPGVYSQAECEEMRQESYATLNANHKVAQWRTDAAGVRRPALLFWPESLSDTLWRVAHDDRLKTIVTAFLGPDVRKLVNQIYFRESGDGDQFAWHQDVIFRVPSEHFHDIEGGYLQTVIAIDRITEDAGAVEYVLGSHKEGRCADLVQRDGPELRRFVRGDRRGVKATAEQGDVLVWHPLTVHGSEENRSGNPRMLYMSGFAREDAVLHKKAFPQFLRGGI